MIELWMLSAIFLSGFMLILRNRIDLIVLFFFSNIIYHWGIIYGYIYTGDHNEAPTETSKAIVAMVFSSLLLLQTVEPLLYKNKFRLKSSGQLILTENIEKLSKVFLVISLFSTLLFLMSAGSDIFEVKSVSKSSALPFSFLGSYYLAFASSGYFFVAKNRNLFLICASILMLYTFVGTRAFAALFVINLILLAYRDTKIFSRKAVVSFLVVIFFFIFLGTYKHFYLPLKALDFEQLQDVLVSLNGTKLFWMLFSAEFSQISMNLSSITQLEKTNLFNFWDSLIQTIPGFNNWSYLPERFSNSIYFHANPGYSYGLGGSFWGEIWFSFGLFGVFVFSQFLIWYLAYCSFIIKARLSSYLYHAPLAVFIAFYLPRNDVALLVGSIKNLIITILGGLIVVYTIKWLRDVK